MVVMVVQFTVCGWDVWFCFVGVNYTYVVEMFGFVLSA